jgi:hypothetical protein
MCAGQITTSGDLRQNLQSFISECAYFVSRIEIEVTLRIIYLSMLTRPHTSPGIVWSLNGLLLSTPIE